MNYRDLHNGAVIVCEESPQFDNIVGDGICIFEGGRFRHAAQLVVDPDNLANRWVYEMTSPCLRRTPADQWDWSDAWAMDLLTPISSDDRRLFDFWTPRLGLTYDYIYLVSMARWIPWNRFCYWLHNFKGMGWANSLASGPLYHTRNGVCSVNVAWALQAIGIDVGDPLMQTPVSLPWLTVSLGPLEKVTV